MANYLGNLLVKTDKGALSVPFFEIENVNDRPIWRAGETIEGSLLAVYSSEESKWFKAGNLVFLNDDGSLSNYNIRPLGASSSGYILYDNNNSIGTYIIGSAQTYVVNFGAYAFLNQELYYFNCTIDTRSGYSHGEIGIDYPQDAPGYFTVTLTRDLVIVASWERVTSRAAFNEFIQNKFVPIKAYDPYLPAGDSDTGGGNGTFDYTGNPPGGFSDYTFPQISAVDTGFVTLYNPTTGQLKALSNYLWSNNFDLNIFKKIVNDPMELFLGLSIVPVAVPDGGQSEVGIGLIGTGIFMTRAASQWASLDCGSVTIPNFTGGYLDYDPYTQVDIYLPYIGVRTLKADEIVGRTLSVSYAIDLLSGACVAWIDVDGHLTYTYMGQCATSIPIVSGDWTNLINGIMSIVGSAATGAIKGGVGGAIAGGVAAASGVAVTDSKISVDRGGTISSAGGLLAHPKPFLIMSAPRLCKPKDQNLYDGYPAYITRLLSDLSGYTEIEKIRLQGIPGTDAELTELEGLLKGGVIF